jgi:hypothetical protein
VTVVHQKNAFNCSQTVLKPMLAIFLWTVVAKFDWLIAFDGFFSNQRSQMLTFRVKLFN